MKGLEWQAPEYEERERTPDWFWALGTIVGAMALASIIYGNYFFAVLVLLGGGLLGFFAKRPPQMVSYEINDVGIRTGSRIYPFENISHFWVETRGHHMLFIKTDRFFLPIISMPIPEGIAPEIQAIFTERNITEEEMQLHTSERIMDVLGF